VNAAADELLVALGQRVSRMEIQNALNAAEWYTQLW
jgi:hypothetical protein